ncbi:IclR family transcriptional regulator [Paenibacillus oryzae]|uniref:Glycerol operon regulatory protein n=1 Tax=Paenibacillus oryzae TaxID=1844972 RepID=A0A1A5YMK1_9BACL|nr:IclR family transcriptional regulator [Paenibacillus oryzae]OBR66615.1 IclR family transcriptional regulator [Paenibacillus oryzae]
MPIIQALDRALQIIDLFDEQHKEYKLSEISAAMNLHKSTVHSLLKTLQIHRYIVQDQESGKYRLGIRFIEKGELLLKQFDIVEIARPHLRALSIATSQTTHLVIMDGVEGIYIDKVEGQKAAIRYSRIGRRVPLHSSAVGKVLTAFRPGDEQARMLAGYTFVKHTDKTIDSVDGFLEELKRVEKQGYGIDNEENEPGVRCAAAPIFNHNGQVIAAMSVSTMVAHVDDDELERLIELLRQATSEISRQLGYRH